MYIEDAELRELYKNATAERLQTLEAALLHLEKNPSDRPRLELFLREAHTLKGDSRMLGVDDVETLIHQMEECMVEVKAGTRHITPDLCDRLYQGIDAVRKLVREAITGQPSGVNTFLALAQLMGAQSHDSPLETTLATKDDTADLVASFDDLLFGNSDPQFEVSVPKDWELEMSQPLPTINKQPLKSKIADETDTLDTIRVETEKLDILMRQAGELSIANLRIAERLTDIEAIMQLYEEWSRDNSTNRATLRQIEGNSQNGNLQKVRGFWHRTEQRLEKLGNLVNHLKLAAAEDLTSLESLSDRLESGIQNLRLLPISTVFNLFPRMVRDLAKDKGKKVKLELEGGATRVDKRIIEQIKDPLLHIIRNAIDHGIETPAEREQKGKPGRAIVRLKGYQSGDRITIEITDDGRGLDNAAIKQTAIERGVVTEAQIASMSTHQIQSLIFTPGFSTRSEVSQISGRGIGLDVVRTNIERLKGTIDVESTPDLGCQFRLRIDTNLATTHALIVEVDRFSYAIAVEVVETMLLISKQEIFAIEGSQTIIFKDRPISVVWLADLLELPLINPYYPQNFHSNAQKTSCIILKMGTDYLGLMVDAIIDRQDIILKPQSKLLKRVRNITGATILGDGEVCMVLNPQDLFNSVHQGSRSGIVTESDRIQPKNQILLVEDSIIIRTQMKRLLEGAGFDVTIAVDGLEGFNKLKGGSFDAVVSDVEMPNMNGFALTAQIRQYQEYQELPIILVTTLASDADKRRGAEVGANAYLTKGDFDQKVLIETLTRFCNLQHKAH